MPRPASACVGNLREVAPFEEDASGGGSKNRAYEVEQGRFAGAVRADETANLALLDFQAHVVDGGEAAETLGDVVDFQQRAHDNHLLRRL